MLGAAQTLLQSTGGDWWPADRLEVERNYDLISSSLIDEDFQRAWGRGKAMDIDQAISYASFEP